MRIQDIPTLTYHKIDNTIELGLNKIHPKIFKEHIQMLNQCDFKGITTKCKLTSKSIFITFDDAYQCVFTNALNTMQHFGFKGIIFVNTKFIGKMNKWDINFGINKSHHLTKEEIQKLSQLGWEIASHGHKHIAYSRMKLKDIRRDLIDSKNILETLTGKEIVSFTSPFNIMPNEIWKLLSDIGYQNIFIQKSFIKDRDTIIPKNLNVIERRSVYSFDSYRNLQKKIFNSSKVELLKENIIHSCSRLTVFFSRNSYN